METKNTVMALTLFLGLLSTGAQAALIDHGNGTFTDDSAFGGPLMWTQDTNLFLTQYTDEIAGGYNIVTDAGGIIDTVGSVDGHALVAGDFNTTNGRMTWWGAMAWADWLDYGGRLAPVDGDGQRQRRLQLRQHRYGLRLQRRHDHRRAGPPVPRRVG